MNAVDSVLSHKVVSREAWVEARKALLAREKAHTREGEALGRQRRALPWVEVEKDYAFDAPGGGKETLADLFAGRSQLIVYHFMFGPEWEEGCPSCSFLADHFDGTLPHLAARDVTLAAVSRAPLAKIEAFRRRMGWRFKWVSSHGSDFNQDYHVSFTPEEKAKGGVYYNYTTQPFPSDEGPGASAFYREPATGRIFHTYSTYGRGLEPLLGTYMILDLAPKGRDEDHLGFTMAWVRHHDRYGSADPFADPAKPYWPEVAGTADADAEAAPTTAATSPSGCCCGSGEGAA